MHPFWTGFIKAAEAAGLPQRTVGLMVTKFAMQLGAPKPSLPAPAPMPKAGTGLGSMPTNFAPPAPAPAQPAAPMLPGVMQKSQPAPMPRAVTPTF